MTQRKGLMVSLRSAKIIALVFFILGTLLFGIQFLVSDLIGLIGLGLFYLCLAIIFNGIIALLLLIDLIRKDYLESFYGLCIILTNIPVAALYAYLIIEFPL